MDTIESTAARDANGRFLPGQSGNPVGKKPGTRNRATLLREALAEGEDIATARIVIEKALAGDAVAARFIVDRLTPRPRGRAIALDLPTGAGAGDVVAAFDVTLRAMASGEITPDEALTVTRVLDGKTRALEARAREAKTGRKTARQSSSPLAEEGRGEAFDASRAARRHRDPHPLAAAATGPFLSPEGRGNHEPLRARLLNSTCIRPAPGMFAGRPPEVEAMAAA